MIITPQNSVPLILGMEFIIGSLSYKIENHPYFLCQMIPPLPPFCSTKRPQVPLPHAKDLLRRKYLSQFLSLCSQIRNRYHTKISYTSVTVYILNNLLHLYFCTIVYSLKTENGL